MKGIVFILMYIIDFGFLVVRRVRSFFDWAVRRVDWLLDWVDAVIHRISVWAGKE